jgi:hypothetical protein
MAKIDVTRCLRAINKINIEGRTPVVGDTRAHFASSSRAKAVEDAIGEIQKNGETALMGEYIGIKNYAAFGDQREDHNYNMGPRHGTIVFRIERTRSAREEQGVTLNGDEVYFLECVRDFDDIKEPRSGLQQQDRWLNLCDILKERARLLARLDRLNMYVDTTSVETTVP